ncbi:MAG: ATP-binding cassette domain-containing protein [Lachnospiraceae bacterium]|nr:ATP-binding cassette domain-containing protein [Lachnospiraceae bacterium]
MEVVVNDLSVAINGKNIFSNMSFCLNGGQMVSIIGESGCGKTTLLNSLGLIQPVSNGDILFDGKSAIKWGDKQKTRFWRKYAAFIYQDYGIIENESIAYNVALDKLQMRSNKVKTVLQEVGLAGRENERAAVLSGGEKQRVGIARAILKNAAIIYADEPTASLDVNNSDTVISLLRRCAMSGAIVILATHDEHLIKTCDKTIKMEK